MKLFTYLSALLITTGAIFGIIDYAKAKNNGTFDKIYAEEPIVETEPVKKQETEKVVDIKKESVEIKKSSITTPDYSKKATPTVPLQKKSIKSKPVKNVPKKYESENPKAPVKDVEEATFTSKPDAEQKVTATPKKRKIDYRDFGRGSIRPRKTITPDIKVSEVKTAEPSVKEN